MPNVGERHGDQGDERTAKRTCWFITTEWDQKEGGREGDESERASCCNCTGIITLGIFHLRAFVFYCSSCVIRADFLLKFSEYINCFPTVWTGKFTKFIEALCWWHELSFVSNSCACTKAAQIRPRNCKWFSKRIGCICRSYTEGWGGSKTEFSSKTGFLFSKPKYTSLHFMDNTTLIVFRKLIWKRI